MTIKKTAKAVTKILENQRGTFEGLQEASFMRSEKYLMDLLKEETKSSNYPIPPFVPLLLIWLFVMLFPLATFLDRPSLPRPKSTRGALSVSTSPLSQRHSSSSSTRSSLSRVAFSRSTIFHSSFTTPYLSSEPSLYAKSHFSLSNATQAKA